MTALRPKSARGFSLVELGIAIAAIAVLATIVMMGSGYMNAAKTRNAVEMVSTLRQAAKQFAMRRNNGLYYFHSAPVGKTAEQTRVSIKNLAEEKLVRADIVSPWDTRVAIEPTETPPAQCSGYTCMRICMVTPDEDDCTSCKDMMRTFEKTAVDKPTCSGAGCGLGGQCILTVISR